MLFGKITEPQASFQVLSPRLLLTGQVLLFSGLVACSTLQDDLKGSYEQALTLKNAGKMREAIPHAQRTASLVEELEGSQGKNLAPTLVFLGDLYNADARYDEAENAFHRALVLQEAALGTDHPDLEPYLQRLGSLYMVRGMYGKAEPLLRRVLKIEEDRYGHLDDHVADSLGHLGDLYTRMGRYEEAERAYSRALDIRRETLGVDHPNVGVLLGKLAELYKQDGQYDRSESYFQEALAIHKMGRSHPTSVPATLANLASLYVLKGSYVQAEETYDHALQVGMADLGDAHPIVASVLLGLGNLAFQRGEYTRAESHYQRARLILERALGPTHMDLANVLNNLAEYYRETGHYALAEPLYRKAITIKEGALGKESPELAIHLANLSILLAQAGQYVEARSLNQRVLAIQEQALGWEHPQVALTLNQLGFFHSRQSKYEEARTVLTRALRIQTKALGRNHVEVALTLNNLAENSRLAGDLEQAELFQSDALDIQQTVLGSRHPATAVSFNNLAKISWERGDRFKARRQQEEALRIRTTMLGEQHPDVARSLYNLAFLEAAEDKYVSALSLFTQAFAIEQPMIRQFFAFSSERQKLESLQLVSDTYWAALSLIRQHLSADHTAVQEGLQLVLQRKGMVLDAEAETLQVRERESGTQREDWNRLRALRSDLARLVFHQPERMTMEDYRKRLTTLRRQIDELEGQLARDSALLSRRASEQAVTIERVTQSLMPGSALVEFVKTNEADFTHGKFTQKFRYLAFVVQRDREISLIDVGDAEDIESLVVEGLDAVRPSADRGRAGLLAKAPSGVNESALFQQLHRRLWSRIEEKLVSAERIVVSTDGLLSLFPFAAMIDIEGRPLLERYELAYVTSGRDLIQTALSKSPDDVALFLAANPAFDVHVQEQAPSNGVQEGRIRSRDFSGSFRPLPGTAKEANDIPPLIQLPGKKRVVVDEAATEESIKSLHSPKILHLATHGFFLSDLDGVRGSSDKQPVMQYENPLIRSGLAFAGANRLAQTETVDDGLLTALEIAAIDLNGTRLVVLSACETAVGEVRTGEGVFGLRRAFILAGASNVVMSLWAVSDRYTARQMRAFYTNLQRAGPAAALRQAQLNTLKELRGKYQGLPPIRLWAPFIVQGGAAWELVAGN